MGSSLMEGGVRVEKLNSSNYGTWKFKVRMLLVRDDLWDVVEDSTVGTTDQWRKRDNKALATICLLVDDAQLVHVKDATSSREAWTALKNHHEKSSLTSRLFLRKRLMAMRMAKGSTMEDHISSVLMLADQLRGCGDKITDDEIVTVLLCSLTDDYDQLITALETKDTAITLDFVKSRLLHESMKLQEGIKSEETAFKARTNSTNSRFKPNKDRSFEQRQEKRKCFSCGLTGHLKANCRKRQESNRAEAKRAESKEHEVCFSATDGNQKSSTWFVDSGATNHMSSDKSLFQRLTNINKSVCLADDRTVMAEGVGDVQLICEDGIKVTLQNVLYVPKLGSSLVSVPKIVEKGFTVVFGENGCKITSKSGTTITAKKINGLYRLSNEGSSALNASTSASTILWHRRLGHVNIDYMKKIGLATDSAHLNCRSCLIGKMTRQPFPTSTSRSTRVLELVHTDVCGPMKNKTVSGYRYFVTFTDDFSRMSVVYLMNQKDEVLTKFMDYHQFMESSTGMKIKCIRSDNGGEYTSKQFKQYCRKNGIEMEFTVPYTPQQNGVSERLNRSLMEMARTMLQDANMDYKYWGEAILTACFTRNRLPSSSLQFKSPYEVWYKEKPDYSKMRVFGSLAFAHVPKELRTKLEPKASECRFLGYSAGVKGYRLVDMRTNKVIVSRDVIFEEETSFNNSDSNSVQDEEVVIGRRQSSDDESSQETIRDSIEDDQPTVRRSERTNKGVPPVRFTEEQIFAGYSAAADLPTSYTEAIASEDSSKWKSALHEELQSLKKNETWDLVNLPNGKTAIPLKWVFTVKLNEHDQITRYKARLVAKGFYQKFGSDYQETFSPVARFASLRLILSLAASQDMLIEQLDVTSAFLQGNLDDEIYVQQPEGFVEDGKEDLVCKLKKSLYGLKQAPRQWNRTLHAFLTSIGYDRTEEDWCVYFKVCDKFKTFVILYVDDFIVASSCSEDLTSLVTALGKRFDIKRLGKLHFFLGIQFTRLHDQKIIQLSQVQYVKKILKRFAMSDCKQVATPQATSKIVDSSSLEHSKFPYREAVGCLMYLMVVSRPDICYTVGVLSRKLDNPSNCDILLVKRVFRYLQGTADMTLCLGGHAKEPKLVCFVDSDWAGDPVDRKSTTGFILTLNSGTIIWSSKKQATVAASSTEAEYVAAAQAAQDCVWCRSMIGSLGYSLSGATVMFEDNQGCIALAKNPTNHSRIKHIDIKYHFIRDRIERKDIELRYIETENNLADVMTKPLAKDRFIDLRKSMQLYQRSIGLE